MAYQESNHKRTRSKARQLLSVFAIAAGLYVISSNASASAQSECGERGELVTVLSDQFGESPVAAGLSRAGVLIEVFSSGTGDTWTLVVTTPDGQSCLIDAGANWKRLVIT